MCRKGQKTNETTGMEVRRKRKNRTTDKGGGTAIVHEWSEVGGTEIRRKE